MIKDVLFRINKGLLFRSYGIRLAKKRIVFGRLACLGRDVVKYAFQEYSNIQVVNQQKSRIDQETKIIEGAARPKSALIKQVLKRGYVYPLIQEQEMQPWIGKTSDLMIMDTFSELTDQLFYHKRFGWGFCSHYSDLNASHPDFSNFVCGGLLDETKVFGFYTGFFQKIKEKLGVKKIIIIEFPTKFEVREKYIRRGVSLSAALRSISSGDPSLRFIEIPSQYVLRSVDDNMPYHFSSRAAEYAGSIVKSIWQTSVSSGNV